MGTFNRTSITGSSNNGERPIYENANGKHLYFWAPSESWIIDDKSSYSNNRGAVYAHGDMRCPNEASSWRALVGDSWMLYGDAWGPIYISGVEKAPVPDERTRARCCVCQNTRYGGWSQNGNCDLCSDGTLGTGTRNRCAVPDKCDPDRSNFKDRHYCSRKCLESCRPAVIRVDHSVPAVPVQGSGSLFDPR